MNYIATRARPLLPLQYKRSNLKALVRCDGSGASFSDGSPVGRSVFTFGSVTQTQAVHLVGRSCALMGGTNALALGNAADTQLATGDWIIDVTAYMTDKSAGGTDQFLFIKATGTGFCPYGVSWNVGAQTMTAYGHNNGSTLAYQMVLPGALFPVNKRFRFTLSRAGGSMYCFLDGRIVARAALAESVTLFSSSIGVYFGNISTGIRPLSGYMDEIVVVQGEGVANDFHATTYTAFG